MIEHMFVGEDGPDDRAQPTEPAEPLAPAASPGATEPVARPEPLAPAEPIELTDAPGMARSEPPDGAGAVLSGLRQVLGSFSGTELPAMDGRELMGAVLSLESLQRSLDAVKCAAVQRLDSTGATVASSGLRTKGWKAHRCHLPHRSVSRELRIGSAMQRFDLLGSALGDGRISADHVEAVANASNPRVEDSLVTLQADIVEFAERHRFSHFRSWLASLVELLDADGAEPDHGDANQASMAADGQGSLHLVMDLSGSDAVVAQRIINEETDRQYRSARHEHEAAGVAMPSAQQLRARAVVELLRRGAVADPSSTRTAVEAVVNVTVDERGGPVSVRSIDGVQLDASSTAVLLCDALLQPLATTTAGDPLAFGRTRRWFTRAQHKALAARDGGCVFPGCDQPTSRCDAHHVLEWSRGGATDLLNAALLCRRHHRLEHSGTAWELAVVSIDDLGEELLEQHRRRARRSGLQPSGQVRVWHAPDGRVLLAQTAMDHHPPTRVPHAAAGGTSISGSRHGP